MNIDDRMAIKAHTDIISMGILDISPIKAARKAVL